MGAAPATSGGRAIPEVSVLRDWEDKHAEALEEKGQNEIKNKAARREEAAVQLAKLSAERNDAIAKKRASNRAEEEAIEKSKAEGVASKANPWELVADLIDTNARAGDA